MIAGLASSFFNKGGQQGVNDLNTSDDKMGVLQKYLGPLVVGALIGNGNDLVSTILRSFTGGTSSNTANSGGSGGSSSGTSFVSPNSPRGSSSRASSSSSSGVNDFEPLPGSNSKTGVSIINSKPGDRRPSTPTGSGIDTDYSDPVLLTSSGRGTGGVSKNKGPGLSRDNSQSDLFSGTRSGSGRRPATPPQADTDY